MNINEGLRENDLEGLVSPVLSVDEYESKIDDDAIVVGFYIQYKDPASDLNRFIQKSAIDILDTEVSPAPTEDGYYVVFVEMERNDKFPDSLIQLLENLDNLVNFSKWKFTTMNQNNENELNKENLESMISLTSSKSNDDDTSENQSEEIKEFFKFSLLDDCLIENNSITFVKNGLLSSYKLIDFGSMKLIKERNITLAQGIRLDEVAQWIYKDLNALLGAHWLVESRGSLIAVSNVGSDLTAVLRKI